MSLGEATLKQRDCFILPSGCRIARLCISNDITHALGCLCNWSCLFWPCHKMRAVIQEMKGLWSKYLVLTAEAVRSSVIMFWPEFTYLASAWIMSLQTVPSGVVQRSISQHTERKETHLGSLDIPSYHLVGIFLVFTKNLILGWSRSKSNIYILTIQF